MSDLTQAGDAATRDSWWGLFRPELDDVLHWSVGPVECSVWRREKEWQASYYSSDWPDDLPSTGVLRHGGIFDGNLGNLQRHVFDRTESLLTMEPTLADRPVVIKSAVPIMVPPGQQIRFYVSTPLWLKVGVHEQLYPLLETATIRLSDTWFGPSTMEGELCYATTTTGRLYLDDLPVRAHRAITPVQIRNQGANPFKLEKLSLPVPFLALFDTSEHGLWTQELILLHDDRKELTQAVFLEKPPSPYDRAQVVGKARKIADKGMLQRTFGAFFGS